MFFKAFFTWTCFLLVFFINTSIRDYVIDPQLGTGWAQALSTFVLVLAIFAVAGIFISMSEITDKTQLVTIGLLWIGLTIVFELVYGTLIMERAPLQIFQGTNPVIGQFFYLIFLAELISPFLVSKIVSKYLD